VKAYDRRDDEGGSAWAAFCSFRDMPAGERSVDGAWRLLKGRTTRAPAHWRVWLKEKNWVDRATEWDRDQDAAARKKHLERVVETRGRQAAMFQAAQRTLSLPIQELLRRMVEREIDLTSLPLSDLYRFASMAAQYLPGLARVELELLGGEAEGAASFDGFEGEVRHVPTDAEHMAAVAKVLHDAGVRPDPVIVESTAEVRQLPRRAAG
jgi:hypothetical protein